MFKDNARVPERSHDRSVEFIGPYIIICRRLNNLLSARDDT